MKGKSAKSVSMPLWTPLPPRRPQAGVQIAHADQLQALAAQQLHQLDLGAVEDGVACHAGEQVDEVGMTPLNHFEC